MPYIQRDKNGAITKVFETQQPEAEEYIAFDSSELITFITRFAKSEDTKAALSSSDIDLIRVLEDLINTLIDHKVILFTDLPLAAREKLSAREKIRGHLSSLDNLVGDDEGLL